MFITREQQIKYLATQIAAYCYAQAVLKSTNGSWYIDECELEDRFYVNGFSLADEELKNHIIEQLKEYQGIDYVEIIFEESKKEYTIYIMLWLSYCPCNDNDNNYFSTEIYDDLCDFLNKEI